MSYFFFFFSVFQFFHAMENDDDNIFLLYNWKENGLFSYDSIAKMLENI